MSISATAPLSFALERTKKILFAPFDFHKWIVMGFAAFLASLADGGGGNLSNVSDIADEPQAMQFIRDHLSFIVTIAVVVVVLSVVIGVLFLWLSSRGKFIFLDNVVRNEPAIVQPWKRYREAGNSLFYYRLVVAVTATLFLSLVIVAAALVAWPDIQAEQFGPQATIAALLVAILALPVALLVSLVLWLLHSFAVPAMYVRGASAREAMGAVWREIVRPYTGSLVLFLLLEFLIGVGVVVCVAIVTCATCCIAGLPYVSSVVFLPFTVFFRCYSLYFIEQVGPDWQLIVPERDQHPEIDGPSQFTPPPGYR